MGYAMSKALELLALASQTGTPIGTCDFCAGEGPLKDVKVNKSLSFACIPCVIDRELA
jgi:hypothetical protein